MFNKIKEKIKNKKGASTIEFVICLLLLVLVTAFIIDLFFVSYKHYALSANCTKTVRVLAVQGGLDTAHPDNFNGGAQNYMTNREFRNYLNELAETIQDSPGEFKVYISYSYVDNFDNVIEKNDILVYSYIKHENNSVTKTYYPQTFSLPYGSFITLKMEYTYEFFYTNIWFNKSERPKFHSSQSCVTEYVSYNFSYHINGEKILAPIVEPPTLDTNQGTATATKDSYFICSGNAIIRLSEEGRNANITDLVIPDRINGQKITRIAEEAFIDCDTIVTVLIPANIQQIGERAFADCNNLVTVKYYEGLERIDRAAFSYCDKLKFFGPTYIYKDADEQPGIETPPRIIFPKTLLEVHDNAFYGCSLIQRVRCNAGLVKMAENVFGETDVHLIYLEGRQDTVLGAPWKQITGPSGTLIADPSVNVTWNSKRTN